MPPTPSTRRAMTPTIRNVMDIGETRRELVIAHLTPVQLQEALDDAQEATRSLGREPRLGVLKLPFGGALIIPEPKGCPAGPPGTSCTPIPIPVRGSGPGGGITGIRWGRCLCGRDDGVDPGTATAPSPGRCDLQLQILPRFAFRCVGTDCKGFCELHSEQGTVKGFSLSWFSCRCHRIGL